MGHFVTGRGANVRTGNESSIFVLRDCPWKSMLLLHYVWSHWNRSSGHVPLRSVLLPLSISINKCCTCSNHLVRVQFGKIETRGPILNLISGSISATLWGYKTEAEENVLPCWTHLKNLDYFICTCCNYTHDGIKCKCVSVAYSNVSLIRVFVSLKRSSLFAEKGAPSNWILELLRGKKAISMRWHVCSVQSSIVNKRYDF